MNISYFCLVATYTLHVSICVNIYTYKILFRKNDQTLSLGSFYPNKSTRKLYQTWVRNFANKLCILSSFWLSCLTLARWCREDSELRSSAIRAVHFACESKTASSSENTVDSKDGCGLWPLPFAGVNPILLA